MTICGYTPRSRLRIAARIQEFVDEGCEPLARQERPLEHVMCGGGGGSMGEI